MKDVGFTNEGNRLVEMSEAEYVSLSRLCMAVENKSMHSVFMKPSHDIFFQDGYDFSSVFEVIRAFYDARFRLTDLQEQINVMRESLNHV